MVPAMNDKPRLIGSDIVDELIEKATASPRQRTNLNFHADPASAIQRLMIVMNKGTYVRPHRHNGDDNWEMAIVVAGRVTVVLFADDGVVRERVDLAPGGGTFALEIPESVYHTWLPQDEHAAFIEFKRGPYDPEKTNEFAPWAPAEGSPSAKAFLQRLYACKAGDRPAQPA